MNSIHQYISRETSQVVTEKLIADRMINMIYSKVREKSTTLFNILTSSRTSDLLAFFNYDNPMINQSYHLQKVISDLHINLAECVEEKAQLDSPKKLFERQIKYWETRPMPQESNIVVAPSDSRLLVGSFSEQSIIQLKEKFFHYEELIAINKTRWLKTFKNGDFAVCRLTPEKYHHNHFPVSGLVLDFYEIEGRYHSCNPTAAVSIVTPYSKNKRTVTVIDTDVGAGSQVGLVMMIEVVALMIGDIKQCYCEYQYENPLSNLIERYVKRGCPKSQFCPGSSVVILIFQQNRIQFDKDILQNLKRQDALSRYSQHFQKPLVETEVKVRSSIATQI